MRRKLILRKETVHTLGKWELTRAAGGNTQSDVCYTTQGMCPYPPTGLGPSCNCPIEDPKDQTIKKP